MKVFIGIALIILGGLIWVIFLKPTIIIAIIGMALMTIGVVLCFRDINKKDKV